jgi:hypothetical protein
MSTRRSTTRTRLVTALAAGVLAAGGVAATSAADQPSSGSQVHASAAQAASTPAADLRGELTALLQEHVYLAGIAIDTGVRDGLSSRSYKAAATQLDANSKAVAAAMGDLYGATAQRQVLRLWRRHIRDYVTYTRGRIAGNTRTQRRAKADLADFVNDFTTLLTQTIPTLDPAATKQVLTVHGNRTISAINATVAKSTRVYRLLRQGSDHMVMVADVLSQAIAKQFPQQFPN